MTFEPNLLENRQVALTGRLASMTRAEAAAAIQECGGQFSRSVTLQTFWLVVGQEGWPLQRRGRLTQALRRARWLQEHGSPLEILSEQQFLDRLGLRDEQQSIFRRYTMSQLTRILHIPKTRLRYWVRSGLIQPLEAGHRLVYFDFQQVASIRKLHELIQSGVTTQRIRRSLLQLRRWLPDLETPFHQLFTLDQDPRLVVRTASGRLAAPCGQLLFDFADSDFDEAETRFVRFERAISDDELFEQAIACEDARQYDQAAGLYRALLKRGAGTPEIQFNLGNTLFQLGHLAEAAAAFQLALQHDPDYVEAWNNLGNLRAEAGDLSEAVRCFRRAIILSPDYADAHYNLAETLRQLGDQPAARQHWEAYLRHDSRSDWAEHAADQLICCPQ